MAKPNKKKIAEALSEWKEQQALKQKTETWRDELLAPLKEAYDQQAAPFIGAADGQLKPILARIKDLEKQIETALLEGVADDGVAAIPQVSVEGALAEVTSSVTRTIAPKDFLTAVPEASRDSKFYECVSVLITKVDKHFGTQFERLIEKIAKPRVNIRLVEEPAEKAQKAKA